MSSDLNDVASQASSVMSEISVSYNGEDDVPLEDAVDDVFKQIQEHINMIHIQLRQLCMADDRNEDFLECLKYHESLSEHMNEGSTLFKSVIKISKQLLPKKPKGWVDPRKAQGSTEIPETNK